MKFNLLSVLMCVGLSSCAMQPCVKPAEVPKPTVTPKIVIQYTTIYENVEYYFDPTITSMYGEAVVALYTIDKSKNRKYRYIPKKDLKEPLTLHQH